MTCYRPLDRCFTGLSYDPPFIFIPVWLVLCSLLRSLDETFHFRKKSLLHDYSLWARLQGADPVRFLMRGPNAL